jgi:hypothetical protein
LQAIYFADFNVTQCPCLTVEEVFKAAGLSQNGPLPWGTPIPEQRAGVYLVELLDQAQRDDGQMRSAPVISTLKIGRPADQLPMQAS